MNANLPYPCYVCSNCNVLIRPDPRWYGIVRHGDPCDYCGARLEGRSA